MEFYVHQKDRRTDIRTKEEAVQEEKACRARCSCDEKERKEEETLEVRAQSAQQLQVSGGLSGPPHKY